MKEYKFSEKNARKTIRLRIAKQFPFMLIAILAGIYFSDLQNPGKIFHNSLALILTLSITAVAVTIALLISMKSATKRLMQNIFRITENRIEHITLSGKIIKIDFDKIDLHKSSKNYLLIKARNQKILIPAEIDNFDEISNSILKKAE